MKFAIVFALIAIAGATELGDIAAKVNAMNVGWTAEEPSRFANHTLEHVKMLCGVSHMKGDEGYHELPEIELEALAAEDLPTSFDWRTEKPDCPSIQMVRDQSSCGSCWAHGSTECFNDRRCITLGDKAIYSQEDTTANCGLFNCGFSQGCNGGQPTAALGWMSRVGIVTGGLYTDIGTGKNCAPYSLAPCAHHVPATAKYPACPSSEYPTPSKFSTCSESKYTKSYADDKVKGTGAYSVSGVTKIMTDLMTNGPQSVAFTVYSDFPTYKSGVYKHTTGSALGGHAVEFVGWGTDPSGGDYWIVKNSWNEEWGDNGYFKIARGSNECGIEDQVAGVHVQ